ncbi:MAG: hypothetical protein CMG00_00250 [Candidatus Marinimicrobia bacterium]|nr:hypothetical protein [Candidatus Neomarinimicrobiota bacterium]
MRLLLMNKTALGYIASHPFWNNSYLPQRMQNNLVQMYCKKKDYSLIWSIPEVSIGYQSKPALNNFLKNNKEKLDSVIFISYQMNHPLAIIGSINYLLSLSIEVHFVIENCYFNNLNHIDNIKDEIKLCHLLTNNKRSPLINLN